MKLLITGSRTLNATHYLDLCMLIAHYYPNVTQIWHGGAGGADQLAQRYCDETGTPCRVLQPDYQRHYWKAAPLKRNAELVRMTDATLALYCGEVTNGTANAVMHSHKLGHPVTLADVS